MCADNKSLHSTDDDSETSSQNDDGQYKPLENKKTKKKHSARKRILAQCLVTGAVMLSSASCGMPVGYSAILLPQLKQSNNSMHIDDEIGSWIASVHSAATPFGSLLSGTLMDRCGRKVALQIASVPLILGWILIGLSQNHTLLLMGRLIAGISAGLAAATGQVLIGEVTEPHLRGILSSGPFVSYSFGILLVYAMGWLLPWRYVAGLSTVLPLMAAVVFYFLPESPVWLVRHNKTDAANNALCWLRGGNSSKANKELQHLAERVDRENITNTSTSLRTFFQPEVIKPLIIINVFNILQVLSGTYLIVFYAVDILGHVQGESIDSFLAAVLTACVRFIFTIIGSILLALTGRRNLATVSGLGTTAAALAVAIFLQFNTEGNLYFMAVFVLIYVAANTAGFMILPGVMLSELFPAKIRGHAGGFTFMIFNFSLFIVAKVFPLLKNIVGMYGVFWIFGVSSLLATCFLYLTLPETKGKTLSEIEDYFNQDNLLWFSRDKNLEMKLNRKENERLNV